MFKPVYGPRINANNQAIKIPAKKEGIETPRIANDIDNLSIQVSLYNAANKPKLIPRMLAKIILVMANTAVFGMVSINISLTFFCV